MIYQEGYVYHIKDEYFEKVQDSNLMQNKEGGAYRPTFYCLRDSKSSLLWMVPLSSRVEKFKAIHDKQMAKYGKCLTIVLPPTPVGLLRRTYQSSVPENQCTAKIQYSVA